MTSRLNSLRRLITDNSLDAVLISSQPIISYLTGYHGFSDTEREAFLLITPKTTLLLTDTRYSEATTTAVPHFTTRLLNAENPLSSHIKKVVHASGIIGFEPDNLTVAEYTKLKKCRRNLQPLDLQNVRNTKDLEEIKNIKKAATTARLALRAIKVKIVPGMTEVEVANLLEQEIRNLGADIAFPTIVAFGSNASVPHHLTGNTKLKKNDLILIDFGAKWNGYCSDCTRTFFIGAVPTEWKSIYRVVESAQREAIIFLKSSILNRKLPITASSVDKISRDFIVSKQYPTIPHSLGHGIGLAVHEAPRLSPTSKDFLSDGMVFSIEPGIYLEGILGVRIEDLFTIQGPRLIKLT